MEKQEVLRKFYTCKKCDSYMGINKQTELTDVTCSCGGKGLDNWIYEGEEMDDQEVDRIKIEFGKAYEDTLNCIDYYMDISEESKQILALWVLGTYLHSSFNTFPFLFINAMRGSGKTRLLKILSHLSSNGRGQVLSGLTESVFFRTKKGDTMILDEFESIGGKQKSELREYLNASYKKGGIVKRLKKVRKENSEGYEEEIFEPFKPIAMANIWGMDEVLGDRCITIILNKSINPGKTKIIEDFENNPDFNQIRSSLSKNQCSLCSVVTLLEHIQRWNLYIKHKYNINNYIYNTTYNYNTTEEAKEMKKAILGEEIFVKIDNSDLNGRNLELFFPLLICADMVSREVFDSTLKIAKEFSDNRTQDELAESKDVSLIHFISQKSSNLEYTPVSELARQFKEFLGDADDIEDRWLNSKWLGRALKRLSLVAKKRRNARGNEVMLKVPEAKERMKMFQIKEDEDEKV